MSFEVAPVAFFGLRLTDDFLLRDAPPPSTLAPSRSAPTLLTPRHPQPKFPPSLSRESEVSRRRPVWPRPDVSSPSGTIKPHSEVIGLRAKSASIDSYSINVMNVMR